MFAESEAGKSFFKISFTIAVLLTLITSLLKGWSGIHNWATANWEMNYDFGLYKRGLPGELIQPLANSGLFGLNRIEWFQQVGNLLLLLLIIWLIWQALERNRHGENKISKQLGLLMLLASPFMVMTSNLVGYYDHLMYLLGFAAVWCVSLRRYLTATILLLVSMSCHEATALIGYPVSILMLMVAQSRDGHHPLAIWRYPLQAWPLILMPLVLLGYLTYVQTHFAQIAEYRQYLLARNTEDLRLFNMKEWKQYSGAEHLVTLLTESFGTFWQDELQKGLARLMEPRSLVVFLPLLLWLAAPVVMVYRSSKHPFTLTLFALLAGFAPLLMHLIAFDTDRIWLMPVFNLLICLWIASRAGLEQQGLLLELLRDLGCVVLFASYALMPPVVMVDELIVTLFFYDYAAWYALPFTFVVLLFLKKYYPLIQNSLNQKHLVSR